MDRACIFRHFAADTRQIFKISKFKFSNFKFVQTLMKLAKYWMLFHFQLFFCNFESENEIIANLNSIIPHLDKAGIMRDTI